MKRFRFLALALLVVAMWSWVAYADIFYNVVDSANTKYGIISGRDYNLQSGRRTNVKQYGLALSFTDHKDKPWVIVDEHISGSSAPDTIDIYDPYGNWSAPASERTDWGSNLYDLAVADNFLYIVTFDRYEGETQASGQVIRVNLDNGFAPDGVVYKFEPNAQILRRPCAIEVIDGKLYVLTYTYDGEHSADAGMGRSELFEFGRNLKLLRQTTIGGDDDLSARNAQFMTQYGGKLYVGSSGGAQGSENSVGAVWEINPLTMDTKKIVDLKTVLTGSVWDGVNKGVSGISIAKDGTAYLLLGGYDANWSFTARLYVVTVSNLINGSVGTLAPAPTGTGYAWDVVYDEDLETLWLTAGNQIEARSKSGEIKKTFAPIDLGGDAYKIALIGGSTRYITAPTGDSSSGVEITVGVGKIVTDLKVIADVEKIEQKLR
ncbi:MAG: hypothetical protein LBU13_10200, partial [Synergistaceae bacterium]|nr:hypothetical protein [Synergistaceae bacterium]